MNCIPWWGPARQMEPWMPETCSSQPWPGEELHCVGATTLDEYRQYIEKDAALERRFQKVQVDEPAR